jgi:hypothetical protein
MSKAAELANLIGNINMGGGGVNKNAIINGAMNVAQRSVSATGLGGNADSYHTVDRFKLGAEGTTAGRLTMSQDSSAPEGFANSLKLACTTADTSIGSAELLTLAHIIEGQNLQTFAKGTSSAKPYAVSFYVKGNASATYVCELFDGDNSRHVAKTFSVTTDWTRVELSFPADTTGAFDDDANASLYLQIFLHAGSNFNSGTLPATWASKTNANRAAGGGSFFDSTDRTFFITGVQLEVGQNPTSFEHINNFGEELARCQRYFHAVSGAGHPFPIDSAYARYITHGQDSNGTRWFYEYPVEMRATPTLELNNISSSTVQHYNYNASASYNMTGSSLEESGTRHAHIRFTFASGISVGNTVSWRWLNNPNASFNFSSEL